MNSNTLRRLVTYGSPLAGATAIALAQSQDPNNDMADIMVPAALTGLGGTLAGKYGGPAIAQILKNAGRSVKNNANETLNKLRGTGALSGVATALPAAAGIGGGAILGKIAVDALNQQDPNVSAYEQALLNEAGNEAILNEDPYAGLILNPEEYMLSSNTDSTMAMM